MMKAIEKAAVFFLIAAHAGFAAEEDTAVITIIASGETHAMLYPCDCPDGPGGGLAERAAVIRKFGDRSSLLLLDAGGFAGGGIYDNYTGGRAADSARTAAAISAMGMMRYDAAAIGDDELQYGGEWLAGTAEAAALPLLSANCFLTDANPVAPPYRIVVKKGIRFAVTAVTTPERLLPVDDACTVLPPFSSVRKIWKTMAAASDYRIIISHLGEEGTLALADSFPECAVIVNGHRKSSTLPVTMRGTTPVMQFGYEGKRLSYAVVSCSRKGRTLRLEKSGWLSVGPAAGADSGIARLLSVRKGTEARPVYDLYLMSRCPYGLTALREFMNFVKEFPIVEWHVWFIGSVAEAPGDPLLSLHGGGEVNDEMTWLAVKTLYPDRWRQFCAERAERNATTGSVISRMRLDSAAVAAWVKKKGRSAVAGHYRRAVRLGISASPTLFVNNKLFDKAVEFARLAKAHCMVLRKRPSLCDSLPECFDDGGCRKKGMIGRCLASGRCGFFRDTPFTFIALISGAALRHPEKAVIATTGELFPNAAIKTVGLNSAKGRAMMKTYAPVSLPFYLFGDGVAKAYHYARVESGLKKVSGGFTFKDGIAAKNWFPLRPKRTGTAVLFIDPLFPDAAQAVRTLCADTQLLKKVRILPVIYGDPATAAATVDEKVRREEALRWLVMDTLYRRRFTSYLTGFINDQGSSYWFKNLSAAGIAQDIFINDVKSRASALAGHWRLLDTLRIKDPITVLIENRQTVVIRNEAELAEVFGVVKSATGRKR